MCTILSKRQQKEVNTVSVKGKILFMMIKKTEKGILQILILLYMIINLNELHLLNLNPTIPAREIMIRIF